jgi:hypothetical protein
MSTSDEYREIALECIASARMSRSEEQRKQLLALAQAWMAAASLLDQGTANPGNALKQMGSLPDIWGEKANVGKLRGGWARVRS